MKITTTKIVLVLFSFINNIEFYFSFRNTIRLLKPFNTIDKNLSKQNYGIYDIKEHRNFISNMVSYDEYEQKPLFPIKVVAITLIATLGIFGTSFFGIIKSTLNEVKDTQVALKKNLKSSVGDESNRGAMTRLTRKEINFKLAQIPVFYVLNNQGGIYSEDSIGYIFFDKSEAESFAKSKSLKVSANSLDSLFYKLVQKKTKPSTFEGDLLTKSELSSEYVLVPTSNELKNCPQEWIKKHKNDVPLFRVPNLVFSKENGLEIPLFTNKEDALLSYKRLESSKQVDTNNEPTIQITSLLDIIQLFSTGGFEGRSLEIYPSMESIENARKIMTAAY
jgi:hypothetical protein